MDYSPLFLSIQVAVFATIFTFILGLLAARGVLWMGRPGKILDGIFTLPMVLPPTVTGFFLLLAFGNHSPLGQFLSGIGFKFLFTLRGAVLAATVVSFPIMYRSALGALQQVDPNMIYAARVLGMSEWKIFFRILLPIALPGIGAAAILSFARAFGEFGATIMIAGNIPGKTQTMSLAVYTAMASGNRALAFRWAAIMMLMSFVTILLMNILTDQMQKGRRGKGV